MTQQSGQRSSLLSLSLCVMLVLCCCLLHPTPAAARQLKTKGDVKSDTKVNADINGGVESRYKSTEKVMKKKELQTKLLLAEAECRAHHDDKCEEVAYIKQQLADQAPAPGKTVTAPCYQDIVGSYFLGTLCDLPPDSKADGNDRPADASTDDGGRRLLAALRW